MTMQDEIVSRFKAEIAEMRIWIEGYEAEIQKSNFVEINKSSKARVENWISELQKIVEKHEGKK